jgi:predicted NBD/HSP70 family sugar kinase
LVGLELRDAEVVALVVDEGGVATRVTASGGDLWDVALQALGKLPVSAIEPPGVAALDPGSPAAAAAMKALAGKFDDSLGHGVPFASGSAAAFAETWIGAAKGRKDVVYFSAATHVSAGILYGGAPAGGWHRHAPAVRWLALNPVEREDYRKTGCLEAEVAASGIVRRFVWRVRAGDHSQVVEQVGGDLTSIAIDHILGGARGGDGMAISVMRDTARYLGMAAANLVSVSHPEILVLGGTMASAADLLLDPVRTEVARRLPPRMMETLTIVPAVLDVEAAPAVGAARLAAVLRQ